MKNNLRRKEQTGNGGQKKGRSISAVCPNQDHSLGTIKLEKAVRRKSGKARPSDR